MTLDQLVAFVAVAEEWHFRRAAEKLVPGPPDSRIEAFELISAASHQRMQYIFSQNMTNTSVQFLPTSIFFFILVTYVI